ncbi:MULTISPECIES: hypothetical protein [Olivibacter]|jgi:hypothetical protein|uniref:DUF4625 domain-containing protein n=2 Tax=Olivibacter TaxID=376469 RepID=A0ABV6HS44_9SPHI|nr:MULTISPECIES: hypothetical protein [Olivibacter]MCL4639947.1 hypothetical protein [Olivibacter sp. UJ_SKK_5.1]MDM8176328.1 hypothetical protein [Olivibacter sp. 47]MDX3915704.1 hypothetical protein [Pseudosphingobacterium sp.]QEL01084.1 hypothetical protein FKG96_09785 [Olivibacter sp. LS-1]
MYILRNYFMIAAVSLAAVSFSSCSKDDPVPEIDQEEYDGTILTFTEGHYHDDEFHAEGDTLQVRFIRGSDRPYPSHVHLHAGEQYQLDIAMFKNGQNTTAEFGENEHQWFFLGAPADVLDYTYTDNRVGFKGVFTVNKASEGFDLQLVLRHGLDKSQPAAQSWNSPNYREAGGSDDFNKSFELHPVDEGHDHE